MVTPQVLACDTELFVCGYGALHFLYFRKQRAGGVRTGVTTGPHGRDDDVVAVVN